jgi:hypothetical protein
VTFVRRLWTLVGLRPAVLALAVALLLGIGTSPVETFNTSFAAGGGGSAGKVSFQD